MATLEEVARQFNDYQTTCGPPGAPTISASTLGLYERYDLNEYPAKTKVQEVVEPQLLAFYEWVQEETK